MVKSRGEGECAGLSGYQDTTGVHLRDTVPAKNRAMDPSIGTFNTLWIMNMTEDALAASTTTPIVDTVDCHHSAGLYIPMPVQLIRNT